MCIRDRYKDDKTWHQKTNHYPTWRTPKGNRAWDTKRGRAKIALLLILREVVSMLVSYPAIFYYSPEEKGYYVYMPDIGGAGTQGNSIEEALLMASDYLGIMASSIIEGGDTLPKQSAISDLSIEDNFPFKDDDDFDGFYDYSKSFVSLVYVDLKDY